MDRKLFARGVPLPGVARLVAGRAKRPAPKRRGESTTYCRKQDLEGPYDLDFEGASPGERNGIARLMANGALITIGAYDWCSLQLFQPGSP